MTITLRLDPNDPRLVTGTPEQQKQAREDYKRQKRLAVVQKANLIELRRTDLENHRLGLVHTPTGDLYVIDRGELHDASHTTAAAYFVTADEDVVLLSRPSGAQTRERERSSSSPASQRSRCWSTTTVSGKSGSSTRSTAWSGLTGPG